MAIENFGDKVNTNGFEKNPENINREGRPASIKSDLKRILESEGNIIIPANEVVNINEDGSVILKLPTQMQLAMKLSSWALSKRGNNSLKAIKMITDLIDGKPDIRMEHSIKLEPITGMIIK